MFSDLKNDFRKSGDFTPGGTAKGQQQASWER